MEVLGALAGGFATALQPHNVAFLLAGCLLGLIIGVLPGLGGTSGVAILLPISVYIAADNSPTTAIIFLAGIYWGALFGGVVTSILFNIPGEPWAVALLFDGYPLAKRRGKPGVALSSSFLASFVGAFFATVLLTFLAKELADVALHFGPAELFAIFIVSFATLVGLGAESPPKALMMLAFGLLLAAVGFDSITGEPRLAFGQIEILSGIPFVPVTIGLFGIGEVIANAEEAGIGVVEKISAKVGLKDVLETLRALRTRIGLVIANGVIGFFFGSLPGHGATAGSFLGYGLARQWSRNKQDFGKGEISGIMAPQAAADASAVGAMVPMLSLGVPGSPTSAVMLAGLFIYGLQPGPLLFVENADFVWGLIASIYLGHLLTFLICLTAVPLLALIMRTPHGILTPFIIVVSLIGAYSLNNSMKDVFIALIFGLVGYWLRKMKYPLAPLVVALVLGDSTERELRKALIGSGGDATVFLTSPVSAVLLAISLVLVLLPLLGQFRRRRATAAAVGEPAK